KADKLSGSETLAHFSQSCVEGGKCALRSRRSYMQAITKIHPLFIPLHRLRDRRLIFHFSVSHSEDTAEDGKDFAPPEAVSAPKHPLNFEQDGFGQEDTVLPAQK